MANIKYTRKDVLYPSGNQYIINRSNFEKEKRRETMTKRWVEARECFTGEKLRPEVGFAILKTLKGSKEYSCQANDMIDCLRDRQGRCLEALLASCIILKRMEVPRDIRRIISYLLWQSRFMTCWDPCIRVGLCRVGNLGV